MTEFDSGASGDASSDSGSSSASEPTSSSDSSGNNGPDWSFAVQSLIENALDSTTPTRPGDRRPSGSPGNSLLNPAIQALFLASGPVGDKRSLVRRIVEAERWFVPTGPDGSFVKLRTLDERATRAFTQPLSADECEGRRARQKRAPTSVVTAFLEDPGSPARQLSGCELARAIPADVGGVIFQYDASNAIGLRREEWPLLTQLADSLDLEAMLIAPAPGQLSALRRARWYIRASNQKLRPTEPGYGDATVLIFTHPDRSEASKGQLVELDGLTLCTRLAGRGDYVGIDVNIGYPVGIGDQAARALYLGPNFARGIVRGVDPRPGAAPLRARTLAEVVLWLDLEEFPWEDREIVLAPDSYVEALRTSAPTGADSDGTVLIQVRSQRASTWRIYETGYRQLSRPGPVLSPVFALARPETLPCSLPAPIPHAFVTVYGGHLNDDAALTTTSIDLGEGQTEILCAGKLADWLYRNHTSQGTGWLVKKGGRLRAARMAGWAHELLKLIPHNADKLPLSSIRSVEGASFLRGRPDMGTRQRFEEYRQRHTRLATRWFNF